MYPQGLKLEKDESFEGITDVLANSPLRERIEKQISDFGGLPDLKGFSKGDVIPNRLLKYQMLASPLRNFVIKHKAIFAKAIILFAKVLPDKPTKKNCLFDNSLNFIDIKKKFFEYDNNPLREEMFDAAFDIYITELEHDTYYLFRNDWLIEEIIKLILSGEWRPRPEGYPDKKHWNEPEPYGGRYSIISKIQEKREEINKLLES